MESTLAIKGIGFPDFSRRDIKESLLPLKTGEVLRTVNGELLYVGSKGHQKYKLALTCRDKALPGFQQAWVGAEVTVDCTSTLFETVEVEVLQLNGPLNHTLTRPPAKGSVRLSIKGDPFDAFEETASGFLVKEPVDDIIDVTYRPSLQMRLCGFDMNHQEWSGESLWRMDFEEI